ncbi:DUF397 domain-containing protein [Yinghuangia soli]|uniref:DUF397 domain-containing protein n=1 Tax=Yinghuangia soli TaxID=2908204 RepID=A0AA41Q8W8_9ACTN|nr:DUF397 domain-containing protein [Yinghuangia soli]MCF2533407.1 DUF397 domain-containing protein [Yinghuangia soli]
MSKFEFVTASACHDQKVGNCIEVATNVPGVVAFREGESPDTVVLTTPERWRVFIAAAKSGEFDTTA